MAFPVAVVTNEELGGHEPKQDPPINDPLQTQTPFFNTKFGLQTQIFFP